MESEYETCGVCSRLYDADEHTPRVLINCGHTLCSSCLTEILDKMDLRRCPFDNTQFQRSGNHLDNFPVNFALLALIEEKNRNTCLLHHGEKLVMFCLQDKVKICYGCALFGEHKGHDMKMVNELKVKGMNTKKELEESLAESERSRLEKYHKIDVLKVGFFSRMENKFEELKKMLEAKELEFTKQVNNFLFEMNGDREEELLLKNEAEKTLEAINQASGKDGDLAIFDQDFSSIISKLKLQVGEKEDEITGTTDQSSKIMNRINLFFAKQAQAMRTFDLLNEEDEQQQLSLDDSMEEVKQSPAKTIFTLKVSETCLYILANNANPIDLAIDLAMFNKIQKISVGLAKYVSLLPDSDDFNLLSDILSQLTSYTSLTVSFAHAGFTEIDFARLLRLLFCKIQHLTQIEISLENCKITNKPIFFFCTDILPKATSLESLTLELGNTLIDDLSLILLAQSLSPIRNNLQVFSLRANHTALTDKGIEKIFLVILGVQELDLQLRDTLVTDHALKVLGEFVMPFMQNLNKFTLNVNDTEITIDGVGAVLSGIPRKVKWFDFYFYNERFSEEVVISLLAEVCPKLELEEDASFRLNGIYFDVGLFVRKELDELSEDSC